MFFTRSKEGTVSSFIPEYSEQVDVTIVTGATAMYLKFVSTVISIVGPGL